MARAGRQFLQLDVNYQDDPRVVPLSDLAQLLDMRAMMLMKRTHSDGTITRRQLEREAPSGGDIGAMVGELVSTTLYVESDGTYTRDGWEKWNDPAADIEVMAKGGSFGNHLRWHVKRGVRKAECTHCESGGESGGDRGRVATPTEGESQRREEKRREELEPSRDPESSTGDSGGIESPAASLSAARERSEAFEAEFSECWHHYPRKESRKSALNAYKARRRQKIPAADLLKATLTFATVMTGRQPEHIMHGSRFFGPNDEWREFVDRAPEAERAAVGFVDPPRTW